MVAITFNVMKMFSRKFFGRVLSPIVSVFAIKDLVKLYVRFRAAFVSVRSSRFTLRRRLLEVSALPLNPPPSRAVPA
jgi:hypothetical protein